MQSTCNEGVVLSTEDQVIKAKIICCLDIIDSNGTFSAASNDDEKYKIMFPNSAIAKAYSQKHNKVKYTTQFGIPPKIKKQRQQISQECHFLSNFAKQPQVK